MALYVGTDGTADDTPPVENDMDETDPLDDNGIFSLLAMVENGLIWEWTGVMGVTGGSSPASEEAQDMEPAEGEAATQEPRLPDHEPDGASPGVGRPAETGVAGASGL